MYVPLPYQENRQDVLVEAIRTRAFGTLISTQHGTIHVSHIPFTCGVTDGQVELIAHLARHNPQGESLRAGGEAVATFLLDDAYISPSWYPSKRETGRAVPTWNYIAVEARGCVQLIEDRAELLAIVDAMSAQHEAGRVQPWSLADAPAEHIAALLTGIVGVRLRPHSLTGAWKLDQKKSKADRLGAAEGLRRDDGNTRMAERMAAI